MFQYTVKQFVLPAAAVLLLFGLRGGGSIADALK